MLTFRFGYKRETAFRPPLWKINVLHIRMRTTARPTAEMETSVPIQYFIRSYFAASSCALSAWISWFKKMYIFISVEQVRFQSLESRNSSFTLSSLLFKLPVSAFWLASSSRIRLYSSNGNSQCHLYNKIFFFFFYKREIIPKLGLTWYCFI